MTDSIEAYPEPESDLMSEDELTDDLADSSEEDPDETLLDQLDRRQNSVLEELDALDGRIQALVQQCQEHRSDAA